MLHHYCTSSPLSTDHLRDQQAWHHSCAHCCLQYSISGQQICIIWFWSLYKELSCCHYCCLCVCSVSKSYLTLCNPKDSSTPDFPVIHYFPEFAQTHVHWINDAIQPSHPLSPPSPPALSLSQHQGLFQWVSSSHHVAKVLELQLQHQSFQWIFRVDFL